MKIKKGQKYKTISKGNYYDGATLTVLKVDFNKRKPADSWISLDASPKIKYKRRWSNFKVRQWWIKEFCERVYQKGDING